MTEAQIAFILPAAGIPFNSERVFNVSKRLSTGDRNCETHTVRPGGLFVSVLGGLIPILLATPAHGGLAASCESSPQP